MINRQHPLAETEFDEIPKASRRDEGYREDPVNAPRLVTICPNPAVVAKEWRSVLAKHTRGIEAAFLRMEGPQSGRSALEFRQFIFRKVTHPAICEALQEILNHPLVEADEALKGELTTAARAIWDGCVRTLRRLEATGESKTDGRPEPWTSILPPGISNPSQEQRCIDDESRVDSTFENRIHSHRIRILIQLARQEYEEELKGVLGKL